MMLPPIPLTPSPSSFLAAASPIPAGFDPFRDGKAHVPGRPCGHGRSLTCECPSTDAEVTLQSSASANEWRTFPLEYGVTCATVCALADSDTDAAGSVRQLATDALAADEGYLLSRAMQFGAGGNPGLSTMAGVTTITATAVDPVAAVAAAADWWREQGLPGTGILHVPASLAVMFAAEHLVSDSSLFIPGGVLRWAFGPGFDPTIGPALTPAAPGEAWLFVTGNFYAASAPGRTDSYDGATRNTAAAVATREGFYAFDLCAVGAIKVKSCCC